MSTTNFFLPGFYENFHIITFLADLMEETPDYFYEGAKIRAAYGCFPGNIWNGGRVVLGSATKDEIQQVFEEYNRRGISLRFTYTNPMLEKIHFYDTYCNLCMELGNNGQNEVLVNSPELEEFLRKMYPSYSFLSSTTKCLDDPAQITEELNKDYKLVVLDSAMNNTEELFSLPHKEKIELIVNHYCRDNCPNRREHYREVGRCQLEYEEINYPCGFITRDFYKVMQNRSFITTDLIYGKYKNAGLCNMKLDGRGFKKVKLIESFVYFLAKPEHRDEVRMALLSRIV